MENPLVSVITSAYNHENYVQETLKSIINQTYENIELIIIDDGSKDNTWNKMQEMQQECQNRFKRIHMETKQNEGTQKTLNKMLELANGEYVYLIASDDLAKPQAIEKYVEFLSKNKDYALCVGDDEIIDFEGKVCYWDKDRNIEYNKKKAKYITFVDFLKRKNPYFNNKKFGTYKTLSLGNYIPNGFLIRKSIFEKTGYFTPDAPLEDWWLMMQISKYGKMKYLNEILFSYRWHGANTVQKIEYMNKVVEKTQEYEQTLLDNLDISTLPKENQKDIADIKRFGRCTSIIGIANILTFEKHVKHETKLRVIKLFNLPIFKWKKT